MIMGQTYLPPARYPTVFRGAVKWEMICQWRGGGVRENLLRFVFCCRHPHLPLKLDVLPSRWSKMFTEGPL